eukprot:CAMPEP_0118962686 /NCGR_PEP_ID=MMETSP1173-20130426/927_1 /TAXON_ID=1034831 /ORGANISM="Rhizochromulina marina cf, Strain CCMP1243" /LENGTH=742 /DNA_ID=CAMNT_0006910975 /DNA_START=39 /DNA_END=2268 /DNA_ORIENTATION=+
MAAASVVGVPRTLGMTKTCDDFERLKKIGEGTYGKVFKARNRRTREVVAMKKMLVHSEKEGYPITAVREIKILMRLRHENIVCLRDVVTSKGCQRVFDEDDPESEEKGKTNYGTLFLVLEFVDHDLTGLIDARYDFKPLEIKYIMKQLLDVLQYMHGKKFVHRDLKCSNILITRNYRVKLADFGLARSIEPVYTADKSSAERRLTNNVITLWYRPPELLLGQPKYTTSVDMWSAGCILAELILRKPLFPGHTELEQLDLIFRVLGTPTKQTWPNHHMLPKLEVLQPKQTYPCQLEPRYGARFGSCDRRALGLIDKLLMLDPARRMSASDALKNAFFDGIKNYRAGELRLPPGASLHELQSKEKRREKREAAERDPFKVNESDVAEAAAAAAVLAASTRQPAHLSSSTSSSRRPVASAAALAESARQQAHPSSSSPSSRRPPPPNRPPPPSRPPAQSMPLGQAPVRPPLPPGPPASRNMAAGASERQQVFLTAAPHYMFAPPAYPGAPPRNMSNWPNMGQSMPVGVHPGLATMGRQPPRQTFPQNRDVTLPYSGAYSNGGAGGGGMSFGAGTLSTSVGGTGNRWIAGDGIRANRGGESSGGGGARFESTSAARNLPGASAGRESSRPRYDSITTVSMSPSSPPPPPPKFPPPLASGADAASASGDGTAAALSRVAAAPIPGHLPGLHPARHPILRPGPVVVPGLALDPGLAPAPALDLGLGLGPVLEATRGEAVGGGGRTVAV